jgi:hypothetical protein
MKRPLSPSIDPDELERRALVEEQRVGKKKRKKRIIKTNRHPVNTTRGLANVLRLLSKSRFDPLDKMLNLQWWSLNASAKMRLPIVCSECGSQPPNCILLNFQRTLSSDCFCNKNTRWNTRDGHEHFMRLVNESTKLSIVDATRSFDWWMQQNPKHTTCIPVMCSDCQGLIETTNLMHLSQGQFGCKCRYKTETMVYEFSSGVCSTADGVDVVREYKTMDRMRYNIAVERGNECILLIEVDGPQHFNQKFR